MNTGIGDAADLAWKLAGTLQGWGGPGLLDSYENDRRQVAQRNVRASEYAAQGTAEWRKASTEQVMEDSPEGARVRAQVAELADVHQRKGHEMVGIELGYRYLNSPVICYDPADDPGDGYSYTYQPRSAPGYRLPHLWRADGTAVHDLLGGGFSLLRLGAAPPDTGELEKAMRDIGAPMEVHRLEEPHLREVYGADLLVLRPDLHVAWRSDHAPEDAATLAAVLTGADRR
jgi:FAD binding domain